MVADLGESLPAELRVDGGMTRNELLMQFQADILDRPVVAPPIAETSALGAAYAAGLAVGFWSGLDELPRDGPCGPSLGPRTWTRRPARRASPGGTRASSGRSAGSIRPADAATIVRPNVRRDGERRGPKPQFARRPHRHAMPLHL